MAMAMGEYGGGRGGSLGGGNLGGGGGPTSGVTYTGNTAAYPGRHPYQNPNAAAPSAVQRGYTANPGGAPGLGGGGYGGATFAGGWG